MGEQDGPALVFSHFGKRKMNVILKAAPPCEKCTFFTLPPQMIHVRAEPRKERHRHTQEGLKADEFIAKALCSMLVLIGKQLPCRPLVSSV